jgi:tetratricopeptide (TPR) repeat protein
MKRKLYGNEHPLVAASLYELASVLPKRGNLAEAEVMHREALAMKQKLLGNEHPTVATSLYALANVLQDRGDLVEAESLFRKALAISRGPAVGNAVDLEAYLNGLAENLFSQSKFGEAESLYREIVESRQARLPAEDSEVTGSVSSLGRLLADWVWSESGRSFEIEQVNRADRLPGTPGTKPEVAERAREAERLLRNCLATQSRSAKATDWRTDENRSRLGGAVFAVAVTDPTLTSEDCLAKFTQAESLLLESNEVLQQREKVDIKYKRDSFTRLVRLYEAWHEPDKAASWRQKLTDFNNANAKLARGETDDSHKP